MRRGHGVQVVACLLLHPTHVPWAKETQRGGRGVARDPRERGSHGVGGLCGEGLAHLGKDNPPPQMHPTAPHLAAER